MKLNVNRERIHHQMASLGLTARQVVARTGIATGAFDRMRAQGTVAGHITVGQLAAVANLLDLTMSDLFLTSDVETERPHSEPDPDADTEYLIPVLASIGKYVNISRLAQNLGWDYRRAQTAVDSVPDRLHGTGFRLLVADSEVAIQPVAGHLSAKLVARLSANSVPLSFTGATLLRRVLVGDNVSERKMSHPRRLAAAAHKNVGLIDLDENGRYKPTAMLMSAFPDLG